MFHIRQRWRRHSIPFHHHSLNPSSRHPPDPSAYATAQSDVAARPACRTSDAARCPLPNSPEPLYRSAPMFRCDRNRRPSRPAVLSVNTDKAQNEKTKRRTQHTHARTGHPPVGGRGRHTYRMGVYSALSLRQFYLLHT